MREDLNLRSFLLHVDRMSSFEMLCYYKFNLDFTRFVLGKFTLTILPQVYQNGPKIDILKFLISVSIMVKPQSLKTLACVQTLPLFMLHVETRESLHAGYKDSKPQSLKASKPQSLS